jgi:hypothetical protein
MVVAFSPFQRAVANLLGPWPWGKDITGGPAQELIGMKWLLLININILIAQPPKIWASFSTHQNLKSVNIGTSRASG